MVKKINDQMLRQFVMGSTRRTENSPKDFSSGLIISFVDWQVACNARSLHGSAVSKMLIKMS
jgi:hypothetical protein